MQEARDSSLVESPQLLGPSNPADAPFAPVDDAPTEIKTSQEILAPPRGVSTADSSLIGASLDYFELLDCIGVGGMGRVFRARDTRLDRLVALKVLSPELNQDAEIVKRFEQEAKSAARLDDRHFARVYCTGQSQNLHYIAMEFVEGENLRQSIQLKGRLEVEAVLNVAIQIARGLVHAAESGVVHRDIKPSNIIVTPEGTAKLVDMGLARSFLKSSSHASELTQAGVTLGTFDYISPEQARDPRDADIRSDIYSLGCTLYHALTGRPPFPEGSALQKLLQHQSDAAPDPRRFVPGLPEVVVGMTLKMLAKDPKDRYQSPVELIADLAIIGQSLDVPLVEDAEWVANLTATQSFWERQLPWLAPMLLLLAGVGIYGYFDRPSDLELPPASQVSNPRNSDVAPTTNAARIGAVAAKNAAAAPIKSSPERRGEVVKVTRSMDLRAELAKAAPGDVLELVDDLYEIRPNRQGGGGLVVKQNVTLRGVGDALATLSMDASRGETDSDQSNAALITIDSAAVRLEGLKLQVLCSPEARRGIATIKVRDASVEIAKCYFKLLGGPRDFPCAMIDVESSSAGATRSAVKAQRCYFGGGQGQDCFRVGGDRRVDLTLEDCAINQYKRPFFFNGSDDFELDVRLQNVSLFLGDGPVFQLPEIRGDLLFSVSRCVFARLRNTTSFPLVKVKLDSAAVEEWWRGEGNLYHGFEKLVVVGDKPKATRMDELAALGLTEKNSHVMPLAVYPWHLADPQNIVERDEQRRVSENPVSVFRLGQQANLLTRGKEGQPIGVQQSPWGAVDRVSATVIAPPAPTPSNPATPARQAVASAASAAASNRLAEQVPTVLVVDPSVPAGTKKGGYRSLASACNDAGNGSTIELETNETIPIRDIRITGKELSIRAAAGFAPKLTLGPSTPGRDEPARLFQLLGGAKMHVIGVPIEIESAPFDSGTEPAAVFDCEERSALELRSLWVSLGRKNRTPSIVLCRIRPPVGVGTSGMPGMTTDAAPVQLELGHCDVRSRGSLVLADPRSYWRASVSESFVASEGAAFLVRGPTVMLTDPQPNRIELTRSSFLLRDALAWVSADGARPAPPRRIEVQSEQTIYIGARDGVTLNRSTGAHDAAAQLDSIHWTGTGNFIAGFGVFLQHGGNGPGDMTPPSDFLNAESWLRHGSLTRDDFFIGAAKAADFQRASIWDQSVVTVAQCRKLGLPDERGGNLGVPLGVLPERGATRADGLLNMPN